MFAAYNQVLYSAAAYILTRVSVFDGIMTICSKILLFLAVQVFFYCFYNVEALPVVSLQIFAIIDNRKRVY